MSSKSGNTGLRYRPGKTITLDPATLQYLKDNQDLLDRQRPGFFHRVSACLDWLQQWSVKVVVVLYVIMLTIILYRRWASDPNALKPDRYLSIEPRPDGMAPFPSISAFQIPSNLGSLLEFDTIRSLVDESTGKLRRSDDGNIGISTRAESILSLELLSSNQSFVYEAALLSAAWAVAPGPFHPQSRSHLEPSVESNTTLRVTGAGPTTETMQYRHDRLQVNVLSGSIQVVIWNSSCIEACYPYSFMGPNSGQCQVNHSNATRSDFPLFGKLLDANVLPYLIEVQPGQSIEIPALWMYELQTRSPSAAALCRFSDISLAALDELPVGATFQPIVDEATDYLLPALSLFIGHLQRRLSAPDLIANLIHTRFPKEPDTQEPVLHSCHVEGVLSNGMTIAQFLRKQASAAADLILTLDPIQRSLSAQDFIERMLKVTLKAELTPEMFLRSHLTICASTY